MLIDTSIWIDHFRHRSDRLSGYLESGEAWTHPFIIGELACGALTRRGGRGLGWVDMRLLWLPRTVPVCSCGPATGSSRVRQEKSSLDPGFSDRVALCVNCVVARAAI